MDPVSKNELHIPGKDHEKGCGDWRIIKKTIAGESKYFLGSAGEKTFKDLDVAVVLSGKKVKSILGVGNSLRDQALNDRLSTKPPPAPAAPSPKKSAQQERDQKVKEAAMALLSKKKLEDQEAEKKRQEQQEAEKKKREDQEAEKKKQEQQEAEKKKKKREDQEAEKKKEEQQTAEKKRQEEQEAEKKKRDQDAAEEEAKIQAEAVLLAQQMAESQAIEVGEGTQQGANDSDVVAAAGALGGLTSALPSNPDLKET